MDEIILAKKDCVFAGLTYGGFFGDLSDLDFTFDSDKYVGSDYWKRKPISCFMFYVYDGNNRFNNQFYLTIEQIAEGDPDYIANMLKFEKVAFEDDLIKILKKHSKISEDEIILNKTKIDSAIKIKYYPTIDELVEKLLLKDVWDEEENNSKADFYYGSSGNNIEEDNWDAYTDGNYGDFEGEIDPEKIGL